MPKDMEIRILRREADGVDIPLCVCVCVNSPLFVCK